MSYVASAVGTQQLYASVSNNMSNYRGSSLPNPDFFAPQDALPISGNVVNPVATHKTINKANKTSNFSNTSRHDLRDASGKFRKA
jgi:hypothetical protein